MSRTIERTRQEQLARIRTRLSKIDYRGSDEVRELINVIKAILDVLSDDGEDYE